MILDDFAGSPLVRKQDSPLARMLTKTRHYNMTCIIVAQTIRFVSLNIKRLATDIVIFSKFSDEDFMAVLNQTPNHVDKKDALEKYKQLTGIHDYFQLNIAADQVKITNFYVYQMGIFGKIWNGVKQAAGVAGKLLQNDNVRKGLAKGMGVAASMIPAMGPAASKAVQNFVNKGLDRLNEVVNKAPEGNVKSGLEHVQDVLADASDFAGKIPVLNKYQGTLNKLHNISKTKEVTDLLSSKPKISNAKTNQYRSSQVVYGQSTQPIVRTKQTFPDGITVSSATIQKKGRRTKKAATEGSLRAKRARHEVKRIKRKVRK